MSYIGQGLEQAYSERYVFTAAGGETSVSVADDGRTVAYAIGQVDVYKNGLRLVSGNDFSASSGTSITGLATLSAGDVVEIVAYAVVIAPDAVSASAGGTFQDAITVQGAVSATGVVSASGGSSTDWNTAYAWGNHASAGYLTGNQTITLTGDVSGSGTTSIAVTIADDSHSHVISNVDGLQTALDSKLPSATWTSSSASGITATQVTNWNTAYGWGDHASAGYQAASSALTTSTTFGGDVSGTYNAIVVADDSHNHVISNVDGLQTALDAKLASSSYTAADVLTKIKTVDGSGSGLDADLLDGQHGSYYLTDNTYLLRDDNRTVSPSEYASGRVAFGFTSWGNNNTSPYADFLHMRSYTDSSGGADNLLMLKKDGIGMRLWQQTYGSSTAYSSYVDVWHTGNDGSGSGLDADTVDGLHASSFLRDAADSEQTAHFGTIFWNESAVRVNSDPRANEPGYNADNINIHWWTTTAAGANYGQMGHALYNGSDYQYLHTKASQNHLYINNNVVWNAGNDGAGSGLDADTLDGNQSSFFADKTNQQTFNAPLNINGGTAQGTYDATLYVTATNNNDWGLIVNKYNQSSNEYGIDLRVGSSATHAFRVLGNGGEKFRINGTGQAFYQGSSYWHALNDGSGSGLDADLLDGVHASSFVRSDAVTIMSSTGIGRNDHHRGHLVGSYNNVGANDSKTNPIYSIGSSYIPSATSTSGFYGLGFSHPNFWGSGKTAGWGIYTTDNGNITFTAGYSAGTSGIGVWSQGVVDARGFTTNSNPWGTSNSAWMPNGITTPGVTSWLYGTVYLGQAPGNGSGSQADASGINTVGFNKAYSYQGNGNVSGTGNASYHPSGIYSTGTNWLYGTMYMNGYSQYMSGGNMYSTNKIVCDTNYGEGVYGVYSSYRYQHVWMMGTAYQLAANGTSVGNAYGLSYTHTNVGTGTNQAISGLSHQLQGRQNGALTWAMGTGIWTAYNITAYSDIAVKTNLEIIPDALAKVCQLNGYTYDRTDYKVDPETGEMPETRQAGVVAQEVEKVLPEVVSGEEGNKAVAYGNMVALLIEAIKELKAEVNDLKAQLERS